MSYFAEFAQSRYEAFYLEFLMVDGESGDPLSSDNIDHQFKVCGEICDYGDWFESGQIIASNSNGLIYPTTQPGLSAVKISPDRFQSFDQHQSLRCALIAVPTVATDAQTILTGTISFGEQTAMPRLKLKATPYYPAPQVFTPSAAQVRIQLMKVPTQYDAVVAALQGPSDPAYQTWESGGTVQTNGPLYTTIRGALGYDDVAMSMFLAAANANPT